MLGTGTSKHKHEITTSPVKRAPPPASGSFDRSTRAVSLPCIFSIQAQLLKMIQRVNCARAMRLPSEDELSRTVRRQPDDSAPRSESLKNQGFASRHKGQARLSANPGLKKTLPTSLIHSGMRALGLQPGSRILSAEMVPAPAKVALASASKRRTHVQPAPVCGWQTVCPSRRGSMLSREQFPGVDKINFASSSLYQTLRERYGIRVSRADEILEARAASRHEAELLESRAGPVCWSSPHLVGLDGKPV